MGAFGQFSFRNYPMMPLNLCGNDYEVFESQDFLNDYFDFHSQYPIDEWWLKTVLVVGAPGTGKSVVGKNLANLLEQKFGREQFDAWLTDDMQWFVSNVKMTKFINFLFLDDAIRPGMDSRRSMSDENVGLTQAYYLIRHILEEKCEEYGLPSAGILILVLAAQDYYRIDKGIRVCTSLSIFKSYNRYLRKAFPEEEVQYLRDLTNDAMVFNRNEARALALGQTVGDAYVHFNFPYVKESCLKKRVVPEDYLTPTQLRNQQILIEIQELLQPLDLIEMDMKIVKGMIFANISFVGADLKENEINRAIYIEEYRQSLRPRISEIEDEQKKISANEKKQLVLEKIQELLKTVDFDIIDAEVLRGQIDYEINTENIEISAQEINRLIRIEKYLRTKRQKTVEDPEKTRYGLDALTPKQKQILITNLKWIKLPYRKIAKILEMPENAAYSIFRKAPNPPKELEMLDE